MKTLLEYRVGGSTDFNENGGWLKLKLVKYANNELSVIVYSGDDGFWDSEPLFSFNPRWITEIIYWLQKIEDYIK